MRELKVTQKTTLMQVFTIDDKSEYLGSHDKKYTERQADQDAEEYPKRPKRLLPPEFHKTIHLHENIAQLQSQKDS